MRRGVPVLICAIMGVAMIIQFFIPHPVSQAIYKTVIKWFIIIIAFAMILGLLSLTRMHLTKLRRGDKDWFFSLVTISSLFVNLLVGFFSFRITDSFIFEGLKVPFNFFTISFATGLAAGSPFMNLFDYIQVPMQATMFSLLAFFIASASFRTFRARTPEATLLLVAALIVMVGRVPVGHMISTSIPALSDWILVNPNMAAKRGIMIGVGLGAISMALKIILGIERSWLGGGGE